MPQVSRNIPHGTELEKKILEEIRQRVLFWERKVQDKFEAWTEAENKVLAYVPETEVTRARKADRAAGKPDYTTIQIPYSYAVLMSALTYITSVFFGRTPVFQYSGRHGEAEQQIQAMEALIDYQMLNGYMLPNLYTGIYDALKYGYSVMGVYWDERIEMITDIVQQPSVSAMGVELTPTPTTTPMRTYAGNKLFNTQPQDFIWDAKFPAREFQKGEFAGRRFMIGWNDVVRKKKNGVYINVEHIKTRERDMFMRDSGSEQLKRAEAYTDQTVSSDEVTGIGLQHPSSISGYELVVEIIPKEWGLSPSDWPEKWVFTCTSDFAILLGVQPLGAWHASYPYVVMPLEPEGYGLFIRGLPETLNPIQNTVDWLINSHFYNIRAALNNRVVADPSRVVMKDLLDPLPGGIIRLKPEGFGTDARLALAQLPITDVTQSHVPNIQFMMQFGERISGVNDQIMGMLDTGGRKTATEVRTSTSMGVNRLKTTAEFISTSAMDPLSKMLVQNSQQFYDMDLKMRIAGDLLQSAGPKFIQVTPDMIAGFYDFVPVDGTLPIDRFAQVNLWKELFQALLSVPQLGMGYDLAGIFAWVAQLAGLRNINRFRIQVAPDQMLAAAAQAGNSVPFGGAKPKPSDNKQGYQQPIQAAESVASGV